MTQAPNPDAKEPIPGFSGIGFLKNFITAPNISVGDYTYYATEEGVENFEKNVLYNFPFIDDKLIIGKFCSIAMGVKFIMNGANRHKMSGFSTFPFFAFGNGWEATLPDDKEFNYKGDIVIGNDVWLGYDAVIMPGVKVGHGSIVGTQALVTSDVPPYSIVGGNPAKVIRYRFDDDTIKKLLKISWWDWDIDKITKNLNAIMDNDIDALQEVAR